VLACKHPITVVLDVGFASEIEKAVENGLSNKIFGEVYEERSVCGIVGSGELGESVWVL
jgi:hypothetical protein